MRLVERAALIGVLTGAFALVVACSGSDDTEPTTEVDAGSSSSSSSSGSSGDSGSDAPKDTGGGTKANGAACTANGECVSGRCQNQGGGGGGGGGGGKVGMFCTIPCATPQQDPAPECADAIYTHKCSGMGFCQIK